MSNLSGNEVFVSAKVIKSRKGIGGRPKGEPTDTISVRANAEDIRKLKLLYGRSVNAILKSFISELVL